MKNKYSLVAILLLTALWLASCHNTPTLSQNSKPQNTESSITQRPATESPAESPSKTPSQAPHDPFTSIRESGEDWITYGLAAYESGKAPQNLKDFFSAPANMTYLTLFDHFFIFDKEQTVPVAEAFFKFVVDKYGAEAVLDIEKRIEYKNEFLKSLGLSTTYTQTPEAEALLASMNFSSSDRYQYIMSFGNVTYYFEDFSAGSPSQYHGFLYFNTTGLYELIDYLKEHGLDEKLDVDREFHFYVTFDGSGHSQTKYPSGNMYINDHTDALHEAVHAMGIRTADHIWLSEGLCDYFGKSLGFNYQIAASYIQILTMAKQGYFDKQANGGNRTAIFYKRLYEEYTDAGGKIDSLDTFDLVLYTNTIAKIELDTGTYTTLGQTHQAINNKECTAIGKELSYHQAASLVLYLANTHGIEKVLEAYHTQDVEATFAKGYEEIKSDWLAYLEAIGE